MAVAPLSRGGPEVLVGVELSEESRKLVVLSHLQSEQSLSALEET